MRSQTKNVRILKKMRKQTKNVRILKKMRTQAEYVWHPLDNL